MSNGENETGYDWGFYLGKDNSQFVKIATRDGENNLVEMYLPWEILEHIVDEVRKQKQNELPKND